MFTKPTFVIPIAIAFPIGLSLISCARARSAEPAQWAQSLVAGGSVQDMAESLKTQVPRLLEAAGVPGLALAILADGEVRWTGGFGVADTSAKPARPVTASTVFEAASLGKPVLATIALSLVESGALNLDRPIARDFIDPDFGRDPLYARITLRQLLSHSAGLPNLRRAQPLKIYFPPGDHFSYAGTGFLVVQHLVEHVTHEPLDVVGQRLVFAPAGMTSSSYVWQTGFDGRAAVGHDEDGRPQPKRKPSEAFAPASLHTTAEDYAKFLAALMNGVLIKKETLAQMLTPQVAVSPGCVQCLGPVAADRSTNVFWGLGWGIDRTADGPVAWHWGDNDMFKAYVAWLPDRRAGLVYFANSMNSLSLRNDLVGHVLGGDHPDWAFVKYDQYDSQDAAAKKAIEAAFMKDGKAGVLEYEKQRAEGFSLPDESWLDLLGFKILNKKSPQAAVAVWELEAREFPQSWHAYDSLGLAYMFLKDRERSIANYKKALELNPNDANAKKALGTGSD
jgi:CubicO group peptidase (beta-lactamase class C family)